MIKRDCYYIMIWNSKFHQTHLETKVRLWTHSHDFPNGKYNNPMGTRIVKMHVGLAYNTTALVGNGGQERWLASTYYTWFKSHGRMIESTISSTENTWLNSRVRNISMRTWSSAFRINMMHHSQGRVVPTTGFPGRYPVPILLFTLYSQGFLSFLLLASPWSEAKGGECSDPHRPRGDHVCTYYI